MIISLMGVILQMHIRVTEHDRLAWSLADISERTGLSVNFLRYEVRRGNLDVRKFGRRVLVTDEALRRYIENGSGGAKSDAVEQT